MKQLKGFSAVEGIIIVGVIVLMVGLGFLGWKALTKPAQTTAQTTIPTSSPKSAEVITTKADLESAEKELNNLNFDDNNLDQAESQANL